MTDSYKLLAEYVETGSEAAFRGLLTRYVDLVYSAAVRLVDGDTHLAQDIAQTVFADLAKMGRSLPSDVMLGGWLHRHTCFVAAKTQRGERRRQARERRAVEMNALQEQPDPNVNELRPILDEAINQLGTEDRTAILLRFFEQLDFRSVGEALGGTEEAAKKRVSRALDKLHELLTARGITLSATALATLLIAEAVTAAPAELIARIAGTALAGAAVSTGTTFSILKVMTTSKLAIGLASAVVVGSMAFSARQHQAQAKLLAANDSLRQQVERLTADAQALSGQLAQGNTAQTGANDQLRELMRLRGEVGTLRRQLADANKPGAKAASRPQPPVAPDEQQREMAIAKLNDAKLWVLAFQQYASEHQNQFPTNFDQVTNYADGALDAAYGHPAPGKAVRDKEGFVQSADQFEIVYRGPLDEVTYPAKTIVMREKEAWQSPDGGWHRTYGFADGHSEVHKSEDGNFELWESQRLQEPVAR